jgi:hypothetical protein
MALAPVFNLAADGKTITQATPLAAGQYTLQLVATQQGAQGSPLTRNIQVTVQAGLPGSPTGLTRVSNTATSAVISFGPPAAGGALDTGRYQVQWSTTGIFTDNGPAIPYCTPSNGSVTDQFGNVWTVVPSGGGQVNAIMVGGSFSNGWDANIFMLVNGVLWHLNSEPNWYSYTPTGRLTDGSSVDWTTAGGPSPLTAVNVPGLVTKTNYNLRVYVTNTTGPGAPSNVIPFTTA